MDAETVKQEVENLAGEINAALQQDIFFADQQKVSKKNISLVGGNGRLYIRPAKGGYHVSLSGKSLVQRMYPFMAELIGRDCDGYCHPDNVQPFWNVPDYTKVQAAAYFYAEAKLPRNPFASSVSSGYII